MNNKVLINFVLIILLVLKYADSNSVIITMDFESGVDRQIALDKSCNLNGSQIFTSDARQTYFTKEVSYGTGKSAELNIAEGDTGFGRWGGVIGFTNCGGEFLKRYDEAWVRVRVLFPVGFNFNGDPHLKFIRFRTAEPQPDGSLQNDGYADWYINPRPTTRLEPYRWIKETGGYGWYKFGDKDLDGIKLGQWMTFEYYIKFDNIPKAEGGQALLRFWLNGKLIGETDAYATLTHTDSVVTALYLFTYWNGASPKTQKLYVDDLKIITSPDKPNDSDASNNPYVGMGNNVIIPNPPSVTIENQ